MQSDDGKGLENVETLICLKMIEKIKENERIVDSMFQEKIKQYDQMAANYLKLYTQYCNVIRCCVERKSINLVAEALEPAAKEAVELKKKLNGVENWSDGILRQNKFFYDGTLKPPVLRKTRKLLKSSTQCGEHKMRRELDVVNDIKNSKNVIEKCLKREKHLVKSCAKICFEDWLDKMDQMEDSD